MTVSHHKTSYSYYIFCDISKEVVDAKTLPDGL